MGLTKDIYDIFADVATKVEARRLQQREEMSRDEAVAYAAGLESAIQELQAKVADLEREHAEEVACLTREKAALNTKIMTLQNPPRRPPPLRGYR